MIDENFFTGRLGRIVEKISVLAILVFSFFVSLKAGERGFFAFDQSVYFDGAWRILTGQVPYKDFITPMGLPAFWIQAVFFRLFGVNYSSYLYAAATVNVLAAVCAMAIIRMLFPPRRILSYLAGLVTAVWFYPPFGTTSDVQTSFFFSFLVVVVLLKILTGKQLPALLEITLLATGGIFSFLSLLSKQSAGLLILPLFPVLISVVRFPDVKRTLRECAIFGAGFAGGALLLVVWIGRFSNLNNFFRYFIEVPFNLVKYRLSPEWVEGISDPSLRMLPVFLNAVLVGIFFIGIISFCAYISSSTRRTASKGQLLSSTLCIYLSAFQYLFIFMTQNQAENGIPFTGVVLAAGAGILFTFFGKKSVFKVFVVLSSLYVLFMGIRVASSRSVHDIFEDSTFPNYFNAKGLEGLKWGEPTTIIRRDIKEEDVKRVVEYLAGENEKFFVFPDFTILYGILGKPSPQPLVWFQKGVTYPLVYDSRLDQMIVDSLEKNNVEIVVLENVSYFGTIQRLDDFPKLKSYIIENFTPIREIGIFLVNRRKYS